MKRDAYVQNGRLFIAHFVAVHSPFAGPFFFFKRAPVVRIERGTFFDAYCMYLRTKLNFTHVRRQCPSRVSNSASLLPMCNRDIERDPVLKP